MKRIDSFDYIRVIAAFGIVLCHCCFGIEGFSFLGSFLGTSFNVIFLTMSAFLLGMKWETGNYKPYKPKFLTKRIVKLAYSYYPFLLAMFMFLVYAGYKVSIKNIAMHLTFLPWFDKLPGFGHLWFITMIVFCYIAIYLFTNMPKAFVKICKQGGVIFLALILAGTSQIIFGKLNLPNYVFIYLIAYILVFINANRILSFFNKTPKLYLTVVAFTVIPTTIYLFKENTLNNYTDVWVGIVNTIVIFSFLYRLLENVKYNRIIAYISSITFEIYLVHHVFCFGKYSIYKLINNPILGTLAIFAISITFAAILNYISNTIKKLIDKKN